MKKLMVASLATCDVTVGIGGECDPVSPGLDEKEFKGVRHLSLTPPLPRGRHHGAPVSRL